MIEENEANLETEIKLDVFTRTHDSDRQKKQLQVVYDTKNKKE